MIILDLSILNSTSVLYYQDQSLVSTLCKTLLSLRHTRQQGVTNNTQSTRPNSNVKARNAYS